VVFCRSGETVAAADYFLAVRTDGERNTRFAHDLAQSACTLHKHEALALSQHVLRPYSSRNLDVARRTYNYRLTRTRKILLCTFGIVCNKWRIFRRATDVCPDFCDVTVKTCCILHNFVRETAFSFRVLYTDVPSRVLRLLPIEVMLQERIWRGRLRGQESLSVGESLAGG